MASTEERNVIQIRLGPLSEWPQREHLELTECLYCGAKLVEDDLVCAAVLCGACRPLSDWRGHERGA